MSHHSISYHGTPRHPAPRTNMKGVRPLARASLDHGDLRRPARTGRRHVKPQLRNKSTP